MTVHNLFLLDKDGISLIDITVGSLTIDPILASGFFAAITNFAKALIESDQETITDMGLQNNRLYFVYDSPLIGVIVVDPEDDKEEVTAVMQNVLREFKKKFNLENWDHDTYPFRKFRDFMQDEVKKYNEIIKDSIFYEILKLYHKFQEYNIDEEWDFRMDQFQLEFGPRLMTAAGTIFEYMGSKIMKAAELKEPDYDRDTQITISDTNLNIWNEEMLQFRKDALDYLHEIETDFSARYG